MHARIGKNHVDIMQLTETELGELKRALWVLQDELGEYNFEIAEKLLQMIDKYEDINDVEVGYFDPKKGYVTLHDRSKDREKMDNIIKLHTLNDE